MNTRNKISIILSLILVVVLFIAAGCDKKGGKAGNASQPTVKKIVFDPKNPCPLLAKEEVEAVMKQKIQDPKLEGKECVYDSEDETKYSSLTIYVLDSADPAGEIKNMKNALQAGAQNGSVVKQIEGIGEYAFILLNPQSDLSNLHVVKGKYFLQFVARGKKGNIISEDGIKALAKQAIDKI